MKQVIWALIAALSLFMGVPVQAATPWPLGVFPPVTSYSGGYSSEQGFASAMGVSFVPVQNFYTDYTQNPGTGGSNWLNSSNYAMGGFTSASENGGPNNSSNPWAASSGVIPMGDIPMVSTASGAPSYEQILQNYINGSYDGMLQGMYANWFNAGYHTQYWRPGVEMNEYSYNPAYSCGTDVACVGLWRQAFQRIYTVMHAQAASMGGQLKIVWNPGSDAGGLMNPIADNSYWPGKAYVDVLGLDSYDNAYQDSSANPCPNYQDVAANLTCDSQGGGQALGLLQAIAFAKQQGVPIGFPEFGESTDNPLFPAWVAGIIRSTGVQVDFVSLWDSNGGCNCEFTDGSKPHGEAAFVANFGASAPPVTPPAPPAPVGPVHAASPAGTEITGTSGMIYDGHGGVWTITSGQQLANNGVTEQTSSGVVTAFWTGSALLQLNTAGAWWTQPLTGGAGVAASAPAGYVTLMSTTALPQSTFEVLLSADEYQGNAQAKITVDGKVVSSGLAVSAVHGSNQEQAFTWTGSYGAGSHVVAVQFLNDAYGGSASLDRNLYVNAIVVDGVSYNLSSLELPTTGATGSSTVKTEY